MLRANERDTQKKVKAGGVLTMQAANSKYPFRYAHIDSGVAQHNQRLNLCNHSALGDV